MHLLIPLCLPIHGELSKFQGFPLFARVAEGLGVCYCFAGLSINALLLADTKALGFPFLFCLALSILKTLLFQVMHNRLKLSTSHPIGALLNFVHCISSLLYNLAPIPCIHCLIL
jgi:hypothetical protein